MSICRNRVYLAIASPLHMIPSHHTRRRSQFGRSDENQGIEAYLQKSLHSQFKMWPMHGILCSLATNSIIDRPAPILSMVSAITIMLLALSHVIGKSDSSWPICSKHFNKYQSEVFSYENMFFSLLANIL
jgi:hypothetical protein